MRQKIAYCLLFALLLLSIGCTADYPGDGTDERIGENQLVFAATQEPLTYVVSTKAEEAGKSPVSFTFQDEDQIGVFAYRKGEGGEDLLFMENVALTMHGGNWRSTTTYYYPEGYAGDITFYAYYPWQEGVKDPENLTFDIPNYQHRSDDFRKSGLMYSTPIEINYDSKVENKITVRFHFKHALSLLQVKLKRAIEDVSVKILDMPTQVSVDIKKPKTHDSSSFSEVKQIVMYRTENDVYQAFVPPVTIGVDGNLLEINQLNRKYNYMFKGVEAGGSAGCALSPSSYCDQLVQLPADEWDGGVSTDWTGSGTSEDPYIIMTGAQLAGIGGGQLFSFKLGTNLDLFGKEWQSIKKFKGDLNGNDYVIFGLNKPLMDEITARQVKIQKVALAEVNISLKDGNVGALATASAGTISDCFSSGTVQGGEATGGLVGYSSGFIEKSFSTCNVSAQEQVGGLVGYNTGSVSYCYATGKVDGDQYVGGLMGYNENEEVLDCYAAGTVTGGGLTYVGGLIGWSLVHINKFSYYTSNAVLGIGDPGDSSEGKEGCNRVDSEEDIYTDFSETAGVWKLVMGRCVLSWHKVLGETGELE